VLSGKLKWEVEQLRSLEGERLKADKSKAESGNAEN
jgi:hypothetical protein